MAVSPPATTARLDFDALYRSSRDDVYAYAFGLLRDRAAAEEVTAQAFERAFRRQRRFDPRRGEPRGWLFGIARNAALDELRRRRRVAEASDTAADPGPPVEDTAESALRRETLRRALGSLDARDRELVALKFFAGLSNREIARALGVSTSNAGTRLHRAVQKLRRAIDATH